MYNFIKLSTNQTYIYYFSTIILSILFAILSEKYSIKIRGQKRMNPIFWCFSFIFLVTPLAFRGYGIDHTSYVNFYYHINSVNFEYNLFPEPLFVILNYLSKKIFNDFQYVYILSAFITVGLIYLAFWKRYKKNNVSICLWMLCVMYYFYMFGIVRMFIAVGLVIYAHRYIEERKKYKYFLFCFIAFLFHYSAIIMFPVYFIVTFKIKAEYTKRQNIIFAFFSIIIFPFIILLGLEGFKLLFSSFSWFARYLNYFNISFDPSVFNYAIWAFPLVIMVLCWGSYLVKCVPDSIVIIRMFWIYISLLVISIFLPINRLTYYFYYIIFYLYGMIRYIPFKGNRSMILFAFYVSLFTIGSMYIYFVFFDSIFIEPFLIPYYLRIPF